MEGNWKKMRPKMLNIQNKYINFFIMSAVSNTHLPMAYSCSCKVVSLPLPKKKKKKAVSLQHQFHTNEFA